MRSPEGRNPLPSLEDAHGSGAFLSRIPPQGDPGKGWRSGRDRGGFPPDKNVVRAHSASPRGETPGDGRTAHSASETLFTVCPGTDDCGDPVAPMRRRMTCGIFSQRPAIRSRACLGTPQRPETQLRGAGVSGACRRRFPVRILRGVVMPWDIETNILANENVLKVLEEGETTSPVEPQLFRRSVFRSFRSQFPEIPDHIFSHQWECFLKNSGAGTSNRGWAVQALYALAERYLELRWGRVTAKLESFQDWQSLLSRISCLPLKCALYARHGKSDCQKNGVLQAEEDPSFFPVPWIPSLEDLIDRQGLHETHLHLNGSTMAEVVWLRGLRAPEEVLRNFAQSYKENEGVKELTLLAFPDSSAPPF